MCNRNGIPVLSTSIIVASHWIFLPIYLKGFIAAALIDIFSTGESCGLESGQTENAIPDMSNQNENMRKTFLIYPITLLPIGHSGLLLRDFSNIFIILSN
jgi:hypothetical protein